MSARVRDIDRLGATLDALVGAGANSIDGLSFDLADPKQVLGEARDAAVADALAKAKRYAAAAGVQLGAIISIEEGGGTAAAPDDARGGHGGRRADRARPDRAVGQRDDHVRARLTESRPAFHPCSVRTRAWTRSLDERYPQSWRCGLRRSEFVQQRLAAGLVFALVM